MDPKYKTFSTLYTLMNYRKTSEALNMTQPAVTKQIQALERELGVKLFNYDRKKLTKTLQADILMNYVTSYLYNYKNMLKEVRSENNRTLRIGATKTVGDFIIYPSLKKYIQKGNHNIILEVDNTETLLKKLDQGLLDFIIVEGIFDKSKYKIRLLSMEDFIGICSKKNPLAGTTLNLEEVFNQPIVVREKGSGTRDIFEHELKQHGFGLSNFSRVLEIGSFQIINQLIKDNLGISFAYEQVIYKQKGIATFRIKEFNITHEFNIVSLKYSEATSMQEEFISEL